MDFISRGSGYTLFLTPREAVLVLRTASASAPTGDDHQSAVLRMKFAGSEAKPRVAGQKELPGKINYFLGNDPRQWRTGISTYAKVAYENLYPGVDLVYYGNQRQLEYDFVVHPGIDPNVIAITFEGAGGLKVDAQGELVLHAGAGELRQRKPFIYQDVDGVRHEVAGSYKLKDTNTVGFQLAEYDASRPLVIDPVLVYSTFLGGERNDQGRDIAVDASGSAYVTGFTDSTEFPTTAGAFDTTFNGNLDVFVTKLNPSGSALVYSTFPGGGGSDFGLGVAVDTSGSAYVTGNSFSSNFPTTIGAFDTTHNGSVTITCRRPASRTAWLRKAGSCPQTLRVARSLTADGSSRRMATVRLLAAKRKHSDQIRGRNCVDCGPICTSGFVCGSHHAGWGLRLRNEHAQRHGLSDRHGYEYSDRHHTCWRWSSC